MKRKRTVYAMIILLATCLLHRNLHSQTLDEDTMKENRKQATLLLIPTALIAYGSLSHFISPLQTLNVDIRNSVQDLNIGNTMADNIIQFMPATAFFALEASRVEAKGDLADRLLSFSLAYGFMGSAVLCVKDNFRQLRPDSSAFNTFPSGHTATAFVSAELVRHYYRDASPLYGIAAYTLAATVGFGRIYNNKHWFGDVVCGAGIGILSARLAILFAPYLKQLLQKRLNLFRKPAVTGTISPFADGKSMGLTLHMQF